MKLFSISLYIRGANSNELIGKYIRPLYTLSYTFEWEEACN